MKIHSMLWQEYNWVWLLKRYFDGKLTFLKFTIISAIKSKDKIILLDCSRIKPISEIEIIIFVTYIIFKIIFGYFERQCWSVILKIKKKSHFSRITEGLYSYWFEIIQKSPFETPTQPKIRKIFSVGTFCPECKYAIVFVYLHQHYSWLLETRGRLGPLQSQTRLNSIKVSIISPFLFCLVQQSDQHKQGLRWLQPTMKFIFIINCQWFKNCVIVSLSVLNDMIRRSCVVYSKNGLKSHQR